MKSRKSAPGKAFHEAFRKAPGRALAGTALVPLILLASCERQPGDNTADSAPASERTSTPVIDPGDGGKYEVDIDPTDFVSGIDNAYMPLTPGSTWQYEKTGPGSEDETTTVTVLAETRVVMGVETVVVHDVESKGGRVVEDTRDWFAQDTLGNVWYFGEETTEWDEDGTADTAGSWEAGVAGALPGVVMWADPTEHTGGYRQEWLRGEAEDLAEVATGEESVTVPVGTFDGVVTTIEWTPLEPDVVEHKVYAPGIGLVLEETTAGPGQGARTMLTHHVTGTPS